MADASGFKPDPPQPLFRSLAAPEPYPVERLPAALRAGVEGIVGRVQCPTALAGQSVLAAAALVAQAHVDVELHTGQKRPTSLYLITVADSGERKSSADNEAKAPADKRERQLAEAHKSAQEAHRIAAAAFKIETKEIEKTHKKDADKLRAALKTLGPPPPLPLEPMITVPEPTFEGLWLQLRDGPGYAGVFSAEGGQFVGGHAMNDDNKIKSAAGLSLLWDSEPLKRARRGDGLSVLDGRRASMHLMLQPIVASRFLADPILLGQGLLSRTLVAAPDSTMGSRFGRRTQETEDAYKEYFARLTACWDRPVPVIERNQLVPVLLRQSDDSGAALSAFSDWTERLLVAGGALRPISGFANKLAEHAARIAGVFQFIDDPWSNIISGPIMADAITLARWYANEALRLYEAGGLSPELLDADRVRLWLLQSWKEDYISPADLQQCGPNFIRDNAKARQALGLLEQHGCLIRTNGGALISGKHRREAWRVVREVAP